MKKILLADDEEAIREFFKNSLESFGYTVILAKDGKEAVALYRKEVSSVVVMDVLMPGLGGVDAIENIRHEFRDAKIIAMSGGWIRQKDFFLNEALSSGADEAIAKPFVAEDLITIIEKMLIKDKSEKNDR